MVKGPLYNTKQNSQQKLVEIIVAAVHFDMCRSLPITQHFQTHLANAYRFCPHFICNSGVEATSGAPSRAPIRHSNVFLWSDLLSWFLLCFGARCTPESVGSSFVDTLRPELSNDVRHTFRRLILSGRRNQLDPESKLNFKLL